MASLLEKIYDKVPLYLRSGNEKGEKVEIYATGISDAKFLKNKIGDTDVSYEIKIVGQDVWHKYRWNNRNLAVGTASTNNYVESTPWAIQKTAQVPSKAKRLACSKYEPMDPDQFIEYSGNAEARMALEEAMRMKGSVCLVGKPGTGKTSIISCALAGSRGRGFLPAYLNLHRLKEIDLAAHGGAKGLPLEYMTRSNLMGIDALEETPTTKAQWLRRKVYAFVEHGMSPGNAQVLSFTGGGLKDYDGFVNAMPLPSLQDRLGMIEPVMIEYPTGRDHPTFIEKLMKDAKVKAPSQAELEQIMDYINSSIPKDIPMSAREIQRHLIRAIGPARRRGTITLEGVHSALSYQPDLLNPQPNTPTEIFADIINKTGFDAKLLTTPGRKSEVVQMRREVMRQLQERGIRSPNEIASLLNMSHPTVIYHLNKI